MKRWVVGILAVALAALLIPIALVGAEPPATVYFSQTGHNLGEPFLTYWRAHGGLPVYGYPITDAFQEKSELDGKTYTVQYFERARLEAHPENKAPWDIILGQLGRTMSDRIKGNKALDPIEKDKAPADSTYFPETKHTLQGDFLEYWKSHGGLDQFGYPLSEPFTEKNSVDGKNYTVQYFERNRFELHPENQAPYRVLLGLLGSQIAQEKKLPLTATPRLQNAPDYDEALFATPTPIPPTATPKPKEPRPDLGAGYIEVNLTTQHLNVWQDSAIIFDVAISSGRPDWETPAGTFYIHTFLDSQDMEGGFPKGSEQYYFQPDVPWVMYFDYNGDAIHGVYWHNNFGKVASSHGCVGAPVWAAKWIYDWAWVGTPIWIHY